MMPARIGGILAFVWRKAVMQPASAPAIIATISARPGWPALVSMAQTAMPSVMLPSTVRSGTFRMRNVMNTPSTIRP